ncbi:MAG: ABC transporter substrate-binding protein [Oscillospiraceae bacterium]|nr:ABC transporter substrate-binding protein [Oscillospiraceae bacterium]
MKNAKKLLALLLALVMCLGMLSACGSKSNSDADPTATPDSNASEPGTDEQGPKLDTLTIGTSYFDGKFSSFFYTNAYESDVLSFIVGGMYGTDRVGAPVFKALTGETRAYNGVEYKYENGVSDVDVVENSDGTVTYKFKMREDLKFSDGEPVTIDDAIFSMYVQLDPTFDGVSSLPSLPIVGLADYLGSMQPKGSLIAAAGPDNTDFTFWTEAEQNTFWNDVVPASGEQFAQTILDYLEANGYSGTVAEQAPNWGYEVAEDATVADFWDAIVDNFDGDIVTAVDVETAGTSFWSLVPAEYQVGVETGEAAPNVAGIVRTGDYSMEVTLEQLDVQAQYQLGISINPMHYYGDPAQYDYDNNKFGFTKGDLSIVRDKTPSPIGFGPYTFVSWENNTVTLKANPNYYLGEPKIKNIVFRSMDDKDLIPALEAGTVDVVSPSYNKQAVEQISKINNGEGVTGSVITTQSVANLGYGYAGIAAKNIKVGDDSGSEASKNLRKAICTEVAVYRSLAVDSYYGSELANVINYPISDTSWAAPQVTDEGYREAFSVDVNGDPIYTDGMSAEERYAAAQKAALGFLEAAGYTVEDGKVTAAPEGAKMDYVVTVVGAGTGDHPAFLALSEASKALNEIGFNLIVNDISDFAQMSNAVNAGEAEMFAMAWNATPDPDMYQIYHSQGGSNEKSYWVKDAELDELIMAARSSTDQTYRKTIYKECLDIVADWAVEIPLYQRQNAICFSTERINISTLTPAITTYWSWYNDIEKLEMN